VHATVPEATEDQSEDSHLASEKKENQKNEAPNEKEANTETTAKKLGAILF